MVAPLSRLVSSVRESNLSLAPRFLWAASKPLFFALAAVTIATAALPNLVLVALGLLIGRLPAAIGAPTDSAAVHDLQHAVVWLSIAFGGSLLIGPVQEALAMTLRARLSDHLQARLLSAVSEPVGIGHLEDPGQMARLGMAQGAITSSLPADAPAVFGVVVAYRLTWLFGCVIIGTFRWWLGVAFVVLWAALRRPIIKVVRDHVAALGGNAAVLGRLRYFVDLATRPGAAKELRVFGLGSWVVEQFRFNWRLAMADLWRIRGRLNRTTAVAFLIIAMSYLGACAVLASAAAGDGVSLQTIAMVLPALWMTMYGGIVTFEDVSLEWSVSALAQLRTVEDQLKADVTGLTGRHVTPAIEGQEIRFESVTFTYPRAQTPVLTGLDLHLPVGRSTALVGVNGAGKTTIVKLLARLHDPTHGRITVDGVDLREFEPVAWRRQIAAVFQDFTRFPLSALENIGVGCVDRLDDVDGIHDAARRAGATDLIDGLPAKWETPLSRQYTGGVDLSGGQWQRIALARALFASDHGANVLVLDEPTAALDVRSESEFYAKFLELTAGLTTLVISHRFSTVRLADQICVLEGGRIVETGSHLELLDLDGRYARMFRLQASRFTDADDAVASSS